MPHPAKSNANKLTSWHNIDGIHCCLYLIYIYTLRAGNYYYHEDKLHMATSYMDDYKANNDFHII